MLMSRFEGAGNLDLGKYQGYLDMVDEVAANYKPYDVWQPVPCPVEGCKGKVHYLNVNRNIPKRISLMTERKSIDTDAFYRDLPPHGTDAGLANLHALILGMQGSAKTTLLYYFAGYFWSNAFRHKNVVCTERFGKGSMIVFRALKAAYEFLAMLEAEAPINLILPKGAEFQYEHPLLHRSYHELYEFDDLFRSFRGDMINVVATGQFLRKAGSNLIDFELYYDWWLKWFDAYIGWKTGEALDTRIIMLVDEMHDLIPGHGQGIIAKAKDGRDVGNTIRMSMDNIRKSNTKLIATTHSINELDKSFRSNFPYTFIKKTKINTVPPEWLTQNRNYGRYIQSLDVRRVFVVDEMDNFNDRPSRVWVLTKSYPVVTNTPPNLSSEFTEGKDTNRARLAAVIWYLNDHGTTMRQIARIARWRSRGSLSDLLKQYPKRRIEDMLPLDEWTEEQLKEAAVDLATGEGEGEGEGEVTVAEAE